MILMQSYYECCRLVLETWAPATGQAYVYLGWTFGF